VVQDFVVDAALELKILNAPALKHVLFWIERWAFESAGTLVTISPKMLDKLRSKVGKNKHTILLPNWIHKSLSLEIQRQQTLPSQPRSRRHCFTPEMWGPNRGSGFRERL